MDIHRMGQLEELENLLGISFQDLEILNAALTHFSYNEKENNEAFEFRGDRVLNLVMADALCEAYPRATPGELSDLLQSWTSNKILTRIGNRFGIYNFLLRQELLTEGMVADAVEALIGAYFFENGYDKTAQFVLQLFGKEVVNIDTINIHSKTLLQNETRRIWKKAPEYVLLYKDAESMFFCSEVRVKGAFLGFGLGGTKKESEQEAAYAVLQKLKIGRAHV